MRPFFVKMNRMLSGVGHDVGSLFLISTVFLLLIEIITRSLFNTSTMITEEYSGYFCAAAILLGGAKALATNHHIRADIILNRLPNRFRSGVASVVGIVSLGCVLFLLIGVARQWFDAWSYESRSFYPSRTKLWIPLSLPLIGILLYVMQTVFTLLSRGGSDE